MYIHIYYHILIYSTRCTYPKRLRIYICTPNSFLLPASEKRFEWMSVQLKVSRAWNTAIVFWLDFCRSHHRSFTARIYFFNRYTVQQMGTLHLTVVGNPSLYFGASAQALAIRVKRRISWQNRASCVVQSIVLQQGAEIMSW